MKPYHINKKQILIMGCLGMFPLFSSAQDILSTSGTSRWDYSNSRVEREPGRDALDITFSVFPLAGLGSQEVAYLFPVYVSADGRDSVRLEPVCVAGKRRYKVIKPRKALGNLKPGTPGSGEVRSAKVLESSVLTVKRSVPFERWMADGRLVVREVSYGCAECGTNESEDIAFQAGIPLFREKDYAYSFIEPEKVMIKCYKDSFDCKVVFPVARHDLQEDFAGNAQELDRLKKFLSENLNIQGTSLKEVHIKGYASPEGSFDYNRSLAQRRTQTLSDYISRQYPALKNASVYRTEGIGEDWEGLKSMVSGSTLVNRDEILFIIGHNERDTEREEAIRALDDGRSYRLLLEEFYPGLRRTTFSLSFDVRPYTVEELPEIFETKAKCLSQHEMYQLAGLYASRGMSPLPVYERAYGQFPDDTVAILNYANALLKYGQDADGALRVLEPVTNDSRAFFPMAVAYNMKGDWRKAEELIKKAGMPQGKQKLSGEPGNGGNNQQIEM